MPTRQTESVQATRAGQPIVCPVIMVRAGIGATSPAEEIAAAEEAAVWLRLHS